MLIMAGILFNKKGAIPKNCTLNKQKLY